MRAGLSHPQLLTVATDFRSRVPSVSKGPMTTPCPAENMDISQSTASNYPSSGYPTPCSSAYDSRRGSIASMQSAASSYAQSFSSTASSFCSTQMPPTPHTSRETLPDDWMLTQGGVPLESATSQDGVQHDNEDFGSETWSNLPMYGGKLPQQRRRMDSGFIFMSDSNEFNNALRLPGSEPDGMMPASGDFRSAFDASLGPQPVVRGLQPPAEIYPSSDIWNLQTNTNSAYPMNAMSSGAYDANLVHAANVGMNQDWAQSSDNHFGLPVLDGQSSTLAPVETFVDPSERFPTEMHSDSFDDSMGSFDGYTTPSTSPCSMRYPDAEDGYFTRIKVEHDPDFVERSARRAKFSTPMRRGSRRDKRDRGISKRKLRASNPLDTFYTHTDDGCQVEVQYQAGIQVDQKTGRYTSLTGETKKQRCRFEGCVKTFARPEHLKRHENTHSKEKPFACAVPDCERAFSRNDNRKAHYETHLKMEMSGKKARNTAVSFDDLCSFIERSESPEEARKMIEKLQNPKTKSKLLRRD